MKNETKTKRLAFRFSKNKNETKQNLLYYGSNVLTNFWRVL